MCLNRSIILAGYLCSCQGSHIAGCKTILPDSCLYYLLDNTLIIRHSNSAAIVSLQEKPFGYCEVE